MADGKEDRASRTLRAQKGADTWRQMRATFTGEGPVRGHKVSCLPLALPQYQPLAQLPQLAGRWAALQFGNFLLVFLLELTSVLQRAP